MTYPERTIATLCSGGECVSVGARAAGFRHLWGIEHRADVAGVAETNGFRPIVSDVRNVDPHTLDAPYTLHVSPPCKEASGANGKRIETDEGRTIGRAVCRFIEVLQPTVFTLENVYYYRKFDSFAYITETLFSLGYMVDWEHLNSADFGVPQTRMRLILRAVHGSLLPMLPEPEPWVGWYEAIEDLIPTLPESQFAPWQLERLPEDLWESTLFAQGTSQDRRGNEYGIPRRSATQPAFTVTANTNQLGLKAFLMPGAGNTGRSTSKECKGIRLAEQPAMTVSTLQGGGTMPRAFLVASGNASYPLTMRSPIEPASTIKDRRVQVRKADEPCFTITAGHKGDKRAWLENGRVVQLTPRALARLQSIPDEYKLPESKTLMCYVIGNAVPPKMYQKIIGQFRQS